MIFPDFPLASPKGWEDELARRTFAVIDIVEILIHWHAGRAKAEIADSLGVDRKTVRKYVAAAEAAGIVPAGPSLSHEQWAARARQWFPELWTPQLRCPSFSELARFHETIKAGLKTNTASTVWQRLRDEDGLQASLASFRRYVRAELPDEAARGAVTVRKDDPPPGQEAQIDYGFLGAWCDPATSRRRRVWAFVMVLAASRHMFVRPVVSMTSAVWIDAHVGAFELFGGVPARLVPDNLKTGVITPDLYDPKLNRAYAELAAHYGALIDPARAGKPKDKPRVERPMPYVRDSFWAGRDWSGLAEMADAALVWCAEVAGRRAHRSLGGAQPLAVFQATEASALLPLPARPFEPAAWSAPKVAADSHVSVEGALYSVGWRLVGRRIDVRATAQMIECFVDGELVKTHSRVDKGRRQTDWNDYPPEKAAFLQRTPTWCRHQARQAGPAVAELVEALLAGQALHHLRAAQGVLGLADRHSPERLDRACRKALDAGDPSYRTVKGSSPPAWSRPPLPSRPAAGPLRRCCTARPACSTPTPSTPDRRRDRRPSSARRNRTGRAPPAPRPPPSTGRSPSQTASPGPAVPRRTGDMMTAPHQLHTALRDLKLSGMLDTLDARLAQARAGDLGHLEFLQVLCEDEIARRHAKALTQRVRRARFDEPATLEEFDFSYNPKIPAGHIRDLAALGWIDRKESIILYGPVGVGKPHRAGVRPCRLPAWAHRDVLQDQPGAGRAGRRARRRHLGCTATRAGTPRRAHPRRLRAA